MTIQVRTSEAPSNQTNSAAIAAMAEAKEAPVDSKSAPEPKAQEQKDTEDSETLETEAVEETSGEDHAEESESNETDKSADPDNEKPKKKGGFQKRIDKLNAKNTAAQQEIEYWKQQALKPQANPNNVPKSETVLKSDGKPTADKFDTHADYVEALTDWKTEQKFKEREAKQVQEKIQSEQSNVLKAHQDRVKAFAEKTKDFNDAIAELDDIVASPTVVTLITSSENGPEIMYELAKNRDEFEKLNKLSPLMAAREIGKIESRLSPKTSEQKVETKKITSAPKPLEPVGSSGKGSVPKSIFDPGLSQSEYERRRSEQMKRRGD